MWGAGVDHCAPHLSCSATPRRRREHLGLLWAVEHWAKCEEEMASRYIGWDAVDGSGLLAAVLKICGVRLPLLQLRAREIIIPDKPFMLPGSWLKQ